MSIIGPYLLLLQLTGDVYLQFFQETLPELLEVVPLEVHREMSFQHDGAPAHFTNVVREYLDGTFGNRWIRRGGKNFSSNSNHPGNAGNLSKNSA
jgi:hypothetical protein